MAKTQLKSTDGSNRFSGMQNDGNRVPMQGATGNLFFTQDETNTPVTSPVTVSTTKTLTVPDGAVSVKIAPVTNPVQVSEDTVHASYFAVPAGQVVEFDCANMKEIYLKTGSSTVVSFCFKIV